MYFVMWSLLEELRKIISCIVFYEYVNSCTYFCHHKMREFTYFCLWALIIKYVHFSVFLPTHDSCSTTLGTARACSHRFCIRFCDNNSISQEWKQGGWKQNLLQEIETSQKLSHLKNYLLKFIVDRPYPWSVIFFIQCLKNVFIFDKLLASYCIEKFH